MEPLYTLIWVPLLGAAAYLLVSARGNFALVLGLVGMALPNLWFAALRWELVEPELLDEARELFSIAGLVAPVLLVLGLVLLVLRQGKAGSAATARKEKRKNRHRDLCCLQSKTKQNLTVQFRLSPSPGQRLL